MKHYYPEPIKTLVAIDGSVTNWKWLRKLKEYINPDNCRITFIAVVKLQSDITHAKKYLEIALNILEDEDAMYMHEDSVVFVGDPVVKIIDFAYKHNFDLIVVGSHSKTAVERFFMGSVSSNVVVEAPIPVLVMKMS